MYIELHQSLKDHPKAKRLARRLGVSRLAALGLLGCLWTWALDYAPDGDLARFDADDLAEACLWEGSGAELLEALSDAGFLDQDLTLHDWHLYGGKIVAKKLANAKRMREARATNVHRTCDARATLDKKREDKTREEETRTRTHAREHVAPPPQTPIDELEAWWVRTRGKLPAVNETKAMLAALELPCMSVAVLKDTLTRLRTAHLEKNPQDNPPFHFFARGLAEESERLVVKANGPSSSSSSRPSPSPRGKLTIRDREHYLILSSQPGFNPADFANAEEFSHGAA